MTDLKLLEGIRRLELAYGITQLSEARVALYFDKLKAITDSSWEKIVERIIEESDRFPTVAEILRHGSVVKIINGKEYRGGYEVLKSEGETSLKNQT